MKKILKDLILFLLFLILLSYSVYAQTESGYNKSLGLKNSQKYSNSISYIIYENDFNERSSENMEIAPQSNQLEAFDSLEVSVIWPLEGYYYITDYLEVSVETNNPSNCEYNFENSGFVEMKYNNGNIVYDYLYGLNDNMESEIPYEIIFRCRDISGTEASASTYFWISNSEINNYFIRQDIAEWHYISSGLVFQGNDEGLLETYDSTYNNSSVVYSGLRVLIFDGATSIESFLDSAFFANHNNISVMPFNGYKVYNFNGDFGDKYILWTSQNYVISSFVYPFENSTPIKIELPVNLIEEYLDKYPSDLNENITLGCFTNLDCNDKNVSTFDKCENPGEFNSKCTYQKIKCFKNSDCGTNSTKKFCSNDNNICTNSTSFKCNNPGTAQASCSSSIGQSCSICQFGCNNATLLCKATPVITVYSPINKNYNITKIPFNFTIGKDSFEELSYIDWNQTKPKWISLCKNCNESGFNKILIKSFKDGFHNLTFMAVNDTTTITKNISFLIDSEFPKISSTLPKSKSFTNGSNFYVKYSEDNCRTLGIIINNSLVSGINSSCTSGNNIERFVNVNLNSHNNLEIEYQFIIKDRSNNSIESKKVKVKVDATKPLINSFTNTTNGKKVTFILNITELNFDEINYIDYNESRPKAKILCSKLKSGICSTTKTLKSGGHNITISVIDKAGNMASRNTRFVI